MMTDPRNHYWGPAGFIPASDEEFSLSVVFEREWPGGFVWHLECEFGTLCHYSDLGGNPFFGVEDWLVPLTGYTREEFLELVEEGR